jgi:hypothetical protein
MPLITNEGARPVASEMPFPFGQQPMSVPQPDQPIPQATMTYAAPFVHTAQQENRQIYHSDSVDGFDRMDNLEEKYDAVQKEVKALRGKDLFGQNVHDLCLVPDVVIPPKFKTPDFEKYTGDTCL